MRRGLLGGISAAAFIGAFGFVAACGSSTSHGFAPANGDGTGSLGDSGALGSTGDGGITTPPTIGTLNGKVFAPEGTIPISGALIYLTNGSPPAIPDGTYCDKCTTLDSKTPFTYSAIDGTFSLPAYATGPLQLVVQKGAFRRVRTITVANGDQPVDAALTTLPGKTDPTVGDTIPKMALVAGAWDHIEISLAKLGIGKLKSGGTFDKSSAPYDYYENAFPPSAATLSPRKLITDPATIGKYQIVFIPCSGSDGTTCNDYQPGESGVQNTLKGFVAAGGKLYVTDYSYEYVRQPWPGGIDFDGATSSIGSGCQPGAYDAPADVKDPGLSSWLTAAGDPSFTLEQSWTMIDALHPIATTDVDGNPISVTPKVWMNGTLPDGPHPETVSFESGCGRVLFSTYHT
ncbi:MAG: hypothetical protein ABI461_11130, partial [Polyangiaceae bacterium]